ncbi:methyl-accepting chemotaxis protein [Roseateles sp.]|uniref:methyl-accepting chemotaxis protein n=1 Tax=Roseateles sp. TaxID=1971397 RepID=UPI003BA4EFE4
MQLSDFRISTKLISAFTLVAVIGGILGGYAIFNMKRINAAETLLYQQELVGLSLTKESNVERLKALLNVREALLAVSKTDREAAIERVAGHRRNAAELLDQAGRLYVSEQGRADLTVLRAEWSKYQGLLDESLKLIAASEILPETPALKHMSAELSPQASVVGRVYTSLSKLKEKEAAAVAQQNDQLFQQSVFATTVLVMLCMLLGAGLGVGISRHVTRPLAVAVKGAQAMSQGDMTVRLFVEGHDEVSQLMRALDNMRDGLSQIVHTVRGNSESVATGSSQIAMGNADLSQRTEQQASALEQTAATMDQLASTVGNNAENAKQANNLAKGATDVANQGGLVVSQVVETMKGINDSSKKIADIISVIDGIAFQTNILALNAAVEAARAGEQGRGFAVVAGEVRALAQRSAEAAREIKSLISTSVERVEEGTVLVDKAGVTMNEIVTAIRRVSDIVGEISMASAQQGSGIAQVGEAIMQMDRVTQQNAALVEESAAAAESLKQQADQLVQVVAVFRLN